jgi:hypothetical protein
LMYSAAGFQGLIPSPHFSGLIALQNATLAVVYNEELHNPLLLCACPQKGRARM